MAIYDPPDQITTPDIITSMIDTRISDVNSMVTQAYNTAYSALQNLGAQTYAIDWTEPVLGPVTSGVDGISANEPTPPTIGSTPSDTVVFAGTSPSFSPVNVDIGVVPAYSQRDYGFVIPTPPTVSWPTFSGSIPALTDIQLPTAPGYTLPPVPVIDDITIPAPPEYSVPDFDGVAPVMDLTEPVVDFSWAEQAYGSDVKTLLDGVLNSNLVNGGSGLPEATEQAIYDRAVSRNNEEEQALLDTISDGMAARGFPMPPGALASANLEAENKILRNRTDLNNDILVQQSKLAQENTHFIITSAIQWENVLITYHSQTQNRALDAAKFVSSIAIQMYTAKIEGYKARVAAYGVLAEAYKARIQGELVKAEFYKAQMEGIQATAEVKKALVQAYVAQVESIKVLMDAYRTEMEGANIRAEIDKTRIQAFLAEVQAYTAQVNATTARYEGYKAQIAGEVAKSEMAKADAEAYVAQVSGYKAQADVNIARAEAQLTNTKAEVEVFKALIAKYQADVQKAVADSEILDRAEGREIDAFKAETAKYAAELDALVKNYMGHIEHVRAQADLAIKSADIGLRATLGQYELSLEAAKGVAQVGGQMVAGMGSAVNASLHAASSQTRTDYRGWSAQVSSSSVDTSNFSLIQQHIYQE